MCNLPVIMKADFCSMNRAPTRRDELHHTIKKNYKYDEKSSQT
jgi:hypothetical protein